MSPFGRSPKRADDIDFQTLFESGVQRRLLVDADAPRYTILAASDAYCELVDIRRDNLVGCGLFEVFPDSATSQQGLLREALEMTMASGTSQSLSAYRYDISSRSGGGEAPERYWSPSLEPLVDDGGQVRSIVINVEEVTDSVLRERYNYGRRLSVENGPQRTRRRVLLVEPRRHLRRSLHQTLELHWDVDAVADGPRALEVIEEWSPDLVVTALEPGRCPGTNWIEVLKQRGDIPVIARVDQTRGQCLVEAFESGADDVIAGLVSGRELMARIRTQFAESALRDAIQERVHRQYRQLFEEAPVAISLLEGPDLVFTLANPALHDIIGPRKLVGRPVLQALPEEELQPLFDQLQEVYRTGEPFFASEIPVPLGGNEDQLFVTFSYQPFREPNGTIRGVASFAYDVTEQAQMRRAVERESRRKDLFLAMLGHELRNPLTPIVHAQRLLERRVKTLADEQLAWISKTIGRQVEQLEHHVNDLLDVGRIKHGRLQIERDSISLAKILDGALESVKPVIQRREQQLSVDAADRSMLVEVDRARITQVLSNLLDNASKYTPPGGHIDVEVGVRPQPQCERDLLVFEVCDDGEGIEATLLSEVF